LALDINQPMPGVACTRIRNSRKHGQNQTDSHNFHARLQSGIEMYSTARPREQIVEYQKGVTGANVERAVFSNDSALGIDANRGYGTGVCLLFVVCCGLWVGRDFWATSNKQPTTHNEHPPIAFFCAHFIVVTESDR
jgi:hypothetical protein